MGFAMAMKMAIKKAGATNKALGVWSQWLPCVLWLGWEKTLIKTATIAALLTVRKKEIANAIDRYPIQWKVCVIGR